MHVEVSVALNFVMTNLYNKLPRRRVDMFAEELEKALKQKFEGHWYPETPFKGSAYRCCRLKGEQTDPVLDIAAMNSGLDIDEIRDNLPDELILWIDPCEVSYKIGEKGMLKVLYSTRDENSSVLGLDSEVQGASQLYNQEAQCFKPIDSLSSSLSNLSMSPSSPPNAISPIGTMPFNSVSPVGYIGHNRQAAVMPMMTTSMFAQTKFGSTKLKTQAKRPARLSPTELSAYLNQRQILAAPGTFAMAQPRGTRPRDPRLELQEQQQRLLLAQHYGNPALLNPLAAAQLGGSLNEFYASPPQQGLSTNPQVYSDLLLAQQQAAQRATALQQGPPSPEASQALLDALNMGQLTPYASLQHLLVAN